MRTINRFSTPLCIILLSCLVQFTALAQDEVYDTPSYEETLIEYNNQQTPQTPFNANNRNRAVDETYVSNNIEGSNDQEYVFYDDNDYDYRYSSRIRRFNNNSRVSSSYYSPFYVDNFWYTRNPDFWGQSIYTSPTYAYNPYRTTASNWGWGNNNSYYRSSSWNNTSNWRSPFNNSPYNYVNNSYNYGSYNSYYGNPYCPTNYVSNTYVTPSNNNLDNNSNSYYGSRPGRGAIAGSATQGISSTTGTKTGSSTSGKNTTVRTPRNTTTRGSRTQVSGSVRGNVRTTRVKTQNLATQQAKPKKKSFLKKIFSNSDNNGKTKSYKQSRSSSKSSKSYSRPSRGSSSSYKSNSGRSSSKSRSRRGSRN